MMRPFLALAAYVVLFGLLGVLVLAFEIDKHLVLFVVFIVLFAARKPIRAFVREMFS